MNHPAKDTVFQRLFLLIFIVLYFSSYASRVIVDVLELSHIPSSSYNPFSLRIFIFRIISAGLTAWIISYVVARPIRRMTMAAQALGQNLKSVKLDETAGPHELRQAAIIFNQMQERIGQQLVERDCFLAAVSHDLRTPLTRLKLRAEKIQPQAVRDQVQNDIHEMTELIDTTLEYLRGDQVEAVCQFDIEALVRSIADDAEDSGVSVRVTGSVHPLLLQPLATRRCINNLIGNAVRYGIRADVTLRETEDAVSVTIKDYGAGIPEDQLVAVFTPFYRLETSRNLHTGGAGMGLSIAMEMARKQGGNIVLSNVPEGGLLATLTLPKPGRGAEKISKNLLARLFVK